MILPPFFAAIPAEIDATAAMTAGASAIVGNTGSANYALALASADVFMWARITRPRTGFVFDASGRYGRALATAETPMRPEDLALRARGRFDAVTSPLTNLSFAADGLVASRLGLRASTELAARDPFLVNRVLYGVGSRLGLSAATSPSSMLRFDVNYAQAGAVAADSPKAVGVDSHSLMAGFTGTYQFAPRLRIGAITRAGFTHFEHALLDVDLTRGPADVATFSVLWTTRWELSARSIATMVMGLTAASPPPLLKDASTVFAPDGRFEVRWFGRRMGGTAGATIGYRSLGPRIGFGMDYGAFVDGWVRPFSGADYRHVLAHVVARARRGIAPLAASPPLGVSAAVPMSGDFTTTAFALGATVSGPIRLGLLLTGGVDIEFVSARIDPTPVGSGPPLTFRSLFTLGISAITSTDPARRLPRDPLQAADDAGRAAPRRAPPGRGSAPAGEGAESFWDEDDE